MPVSANNTMTGKIDAKSRALAQRWHKLRYVYALYGAIDGLNLSYSTLKYFFDIAALTDNNMSSTDAMHDWTLTPVGIATAALESIPIIIFSLLANYYDEKAIKDKKKLNLLDQSLLIIIQIWPYLRDVMKSLKNAYKGTRSAIQMLNLLIRSTINFLILPFSLVFAGLSVLHRLWLRNMIELRKNMMKTCISLFEKIQQTNEPITEAQYQEWRDEIKKQSQSLLTRIGGLLSAAYSGIVDGLYLYLGVLTLSTLIWPIFLTLSICSIIYSIGWIVTRVYEEYDYQRKLLIEQAKADLALYVQEQAMSMQSTLTQLHEISKQIANGNQDETLLQKQAFLIEEMNCKITMFIHKRKHLQSLSSLSDTSALFAGMKDGLIAYGALLSITFAISTILTLASVSFPPLLLIVSVMIGMLLLVSFISHSLIYNDQYRIEQDDHSNQICDSLFTIIPEFKEETATETSLDLNIKTLLTDTAEIKAPPEFSFQKWFETIRSFFSGPAKGYKAIDYTLNPLETVDTEGHHNETPLLSGFSVVSAAIHSIILALRAHARSFGRDPINTVTKNVSLLSTNIPITVITHDNTDDNPLTDKIVPHDDSVIISNPTTENQLNDTAEDQEPPNKETAEKTSVNILASFFNNKTPKENSPTKEQLHRTMSYSNNTNKEMYLVSDYDNSSGDSRVTL